MSIQQYRITDRIKGDTSNAINFHLQKNGVDIDLTNASFLCQFRYGSTTGEVRLELTDISGITITSASTGEFRIDEILKLDLNVGVYHFDIQVIFSNNTIRTYLQGVMVVTQDISSK